MLAKVIGLTGGIGSGKSTIANLFIQKKIPVYNSDIEAKKIMQLPKTILSIQNKFGKSIIKNNQIDTKELATMVFSNPDKLKVLNQIIHPLVKNDFEKWLQLQQSKFVIKESAILFETGIDKNCDAIITVTAPKEVRIERVISRDNSTRKEVLNRIKNQWTEDRKVAKSDFVIQNIVFLDTKKQFLKIFESLNSMF
jgi:dephospho-CoA kinase